MAERRFVGHLEAATRIYQTSADAQLVRACASLADYRDYLAKAHGYERGIERSIGGVGVEREGLVWARSEAIAGDLIALGMRPQEIATLPICEVEPLGRFAAILGWVFVSVRAAYARGMALPELEHHQPFARRHAASYLESAASKPLTDRICDVLEDITTDPATGALVIAAAGNAFRAHRGWFLAPLTPTRRTGLIVPPITPPGAGTAKSTT
jgi:heme oxygenase